MRIDCQSVDQGSLGRLVGKEWLVECWELDGRPGPLTRLRNCDVEVAARWGFALDGTLESLYGLISDIDKRPSAPWKLCMSMPGSTRNVIEARSFVRQGESTWRLCPIEWIVSDWLSVRCKQLGKIVIRLVSTVFTSLMIMRKSAPELDKMWQVLWSDLLLFDKTGIRYNMMQCKERSAQW